MFHYTYWHKHLHHHHLHKLVGSKNTFYFVFFEFVQMFGTSMFNSKMCLIRFILAVKTLKNFLTQNIFQRNNLKFKIFYNLFLYLVVENNNCLTCYWQGRTFNYKYSINDGVFVYGSRWTHRLTNSVFVHTKDNKNSEIFSYCRPDYKYRNIFFKLMFLGLISMPFCLK